VLLSVDVNVNRIYADGFAGGSSPVATSFNNTPALVLPAGLTDNSVEPMFSCGVRYTSGPTPCWDSAVSYTIYNVIINGTSVTNGQTLNIGGTNVIISFPPLRAV
jgi:hypothetical protein